MEGPPRKTPNHYTIIAMLMLGKPPKQTRIMLMMVAGTKEGLMLFCRFHDPWLFPWY